MITRDRIWNLFIFMFPKVFGEIFLKTFLTKNPFLEVTWLTFTQKKEQFNGTFFNLLVSNVSCRVTLKQWHTRPLQPLPALEKVEDVVWTSLLKWDRCWLSWGHVIGALWITRSKRWSTKSNPVAFLVAWSVTVPFNFSNLFTWSPFPYFLVIWVQCS